MDHSELHSVKCRLTEILEAISNFKPLTERPPILDSFYEPNSEENQWLNQEHVPGLKKLKENIKLDLAALEKFLDDPNSSNLPPLSTNAPYLIAVWNELICAPAPVVSVFKSFLLDGSEASHLEKLQRRGTPKQPSPATKVDIVANNGRHWIRVNTVKNSRILSEFREIDSYLTESEDESDNEWDNLERPSLAQTEFDNSLVRMGRTLLKSAEANPIEGTSEIPKVSLRLTRLDPHVPNDDGSSPDPRIAQTLSLLKEMGVDVVLGERTQVELSSYAKIYSQRSPDASPTSFAPTTNINLDLSVLIALISQLTHAVHPKTIEEANRRFIPPAEYRKWKQKRQPAIEPEELALEPMEMDINDLPDDLHKHARALTNQLLQEMGRGLLEEIHSRLSTSKNIVFWTTSEARDRCLRIVSKIGGVHEKRRARALFCLGPSTTDTETSSTSSETIPLETAESLYWQESRFSLHYISLLPIHVFPTVSPNLGVTASPDLHRLPRSAFAMELEKVCADILSQETIPHPRSLPEDMVSEIQRASVVKANPRLTAHTVQSMQWGAELGWTTLTANRTSVKAILRGLNAAKASGRLNVVTRSEEATATAESDIFAAIWIVDPRSLAEGMSSFHSASQ